MNLGRHHLLRLAVLVSLALILVGLEAAPASAQGSQPTPSGNPPETPVVQPPPAPSQNLSLGNDYCLSCHGNPGLSMKLGNGETLGLYIPAEAYHASVHGAQKYACVQCHTNVGTYPHPPFQATDLRDVSLKLYPVCERCHQQEYSNQQDSVHAAALNAGKRQAAVCTDCHTAHSVQKLIDTQTRQPLPATRQWIPETCAHCHYAIYQEYTQSVHGAALMKENNPDVPTCIDCHGVHNIPNPTTAAFRLSSPQMCAKCHTNPAIMDKYNISTQVLNTYVADFHGTTVALFAKDSPDAPTNKPVCFDCHGVHNISRVDDPKTGIGIKDNLLARCKVCHPTANPNFPTAWLSHYIPSPNRAPLVFTVNTFYSIFIPTVLGGMAVLVVLDLSSLLRRGLRRGGGAATETPEKPSGPPPEAGPAEAVEEAEQTSGPPTESEVEAELPLEEPAPLPPAEEEAGEPTGEPPELEGQPPEMEDTRAEADDGAAPSQGEDEEANHEQ